MGRTGYVHKLGYDEWLPAILLYNITATTDNISESMHMVAVTTDNITMSM